MIFHFSPPPKNPRTDNEYKIRALHVSARSSIRSRVERNIGGMKESVKFLGVTANTFHVDLIKVSR